jgi:hypothetical protein
VAAVTRLLDLASHDVQSALKLTATGQALELLQAPPGHDDRPAGQAGPDEVYGNERMTLRDRAIRLADQRLYFADVIAFRLDPGHPSVRARAEGGPRPHP